MMSRPVVLLGLMGSGKTTIGRPLARRLSRSYWDNDEALQDLTGLSAADLTRVRGDAVMHRLEAEALARGIARQPPQVVGAAAAVILDEHLPALLGSAWVVWLRADVSILAARLQSDDGHRPFLGGDILSTLREMARRREPLYAQVAHLTVDVGRLGPAAAVSRIVAAMPHDV